MKAYLILRPFHQLVITGNETGTINMLILSEAKLEMRVQDSSIGFMPIQETIEEKLRGFRNNGYWIKAVKLNDGDVAKIIGLAEVHKQILVLMRKLRTTPVPA